MLFLKIILLILIFTLVQIGGLNELSAAVKTWDVKTGFNFFSLEIVPETLRTSSQIMNENPELKSIFKFNETTQEFEFQLRIDENTVFGNSFDIETGQGYIISSNSSKTITWTGTLLEYDPYNNIVTGFNLIGFSGTSSGGSAKTLLNLNAGLKSVFQWNYTNQFFEYLLKLEDGTIFGNDFNLSSGTAYFVNFEGLKNFGQGRLCLNGIFLSSILDNNEPFAVSNALVRIGNFATVTDVSGRFFFDENNVSLGNSSLVISHDGKDHTINFDIKTPEQSIFMVQYFKESDLLVNTHTSIDYSENNSISFKSFVKLENGSILYTSDEIKKSQQKNQPLIFSEIKDQIENSMNSVSTNDSLKNLSIVSDFSSFLSNLDLKLKPVLKSILISGTDQSLINKYDKNMEITVSFSDGSIENIDSELNQISSDTTVLSFVDKKITALKEGTSVIKITARELDSNSQTITVIPNPVSGLGISNYSSNQVTVSFVTSSDFMTSVDYGTTLNYGSNVIEEKTGKIHKIEISSLNETTKYFFRINLDENHYINVNPSVEDEVLSFTTALLPQSPSSPMSLGGKILDKNDGNLENAVVYVRTADTYPLMALSNSNGIFLVELSNLKNKNDGSQFNVSSGVEIIIDVYHNEGKILNNTYILAGDSPHEAGIYKIQ